MAEWLKEMIKTVDREFDELPDWKKNTEEDETRNGSSYDEDKPATMIQEPRSD
jgi:hypothetical protein